MTRARMKTAAGAMACARLRERAPIVLNTMDIDRVQVKEKR
jgi:hypothetical protein